MFVLVIGETARAANFSLLGYSRETNPELAGADVTAFSNVTSCGTSTEVSVPCMFSPYGRAQTTTNAASAIPKGCSTCWRAPATR